MGLGGEDLCLRRQHVGSFGSTGKRQFGLGNAWELTLNIGNALLQYLLQGLGVLKLLGDLGDDALGQLPLLPLLDLALVPDPGVENDLGLVGQGSLLLELVGLGLKLGGFLDDVSV